LRSATASIGLVGNSGKNGRPRIVVPSEALARELNLVTGLEYRIARTGPGSIALGPVIGLMAEEGRRIDTARLADDAWKNLLQAYDEVKGLTILLGPDSVDWSSGL